ncbi:hypothetical protein PAXRUDRAFT_830421 [Paxillus rubicundulus Ve08.2h10]|uniref:Uncharacterized protein n=1 Tax=Paxillus rubicundulus Ve08.2h10 TaxID=930991 RepID=A0A0D0BZV9_9AGAM|nr:hypothetical protein PAXRUDRAFT_835297 [Paxillus rubicundulus Ve08.2h10]KIK91924.1 hypothetical protein PAXRUDRAFT_830421 [Paxillus rubicundulus Ve08.2h10]
MDTLARYYYGPMQANAYAHSLLRANACTRPLLSCLTQCVLRRVYSRDSCQIPLSLYAIPI